MSNYRQDAVLLTLADVTQLEPLYAYAHSFPNQAQLHVVTQLFNNLFKILKPLKFKTIKLINQTPKSSTFLQGSPKIVNIFHKKTIQYFVGSPGFLIQHCSKVLKNNAL